MSNPNQALFEALDKDGNGTISKDELVEGLQQLSLMVPEDQVDNFFHAVDTDGDGEISLNEFEAFVSTHHPNNCPHSNVFHALNKVLPVLKKLQSVETKTNLEFDKKVKILIIRLLSTSH